MKTLEQYASREEWLAARGIVGGSDVLAVLGLSPFVPPLLLWAEKTGKVAPNEPTIPMRLGLACQPLALELLEERSGVKVVPAPPHSLLRHPEKHWLTMSPDGFAYGVGSEEMPGLVEVKTTSHWNKGQWLDRGSVASLGAEAQIVHGYIAADSKAHTEALLGVLVLGDGDNYLWRPTEIQSDLLSSILEREEEFVDHVQRDIPPPTEWQAASADVLPRVLPYARRQIVTISADAQKTIDEWSVTKDQIRALTKRRDELQGRLQNEILLAAGLDPDPRAIPLRIDAATPTGSHLQWSLTRRRGYTVHDGVVTRFVLR